MMPLPQKFDQNEWFLLIGIILSYTIIFLLPKRFPLSLSVLMMLFGATVARLSDHLLASPRLDLYNLMDTRKFDLFDLITYFYYAPFSYLFVYVYSRLQIKGFWVLGYIIIWSLVGTIFEWINKEFHVFSFHGWKLPYSFTVYLITQCLTLLLYQYIKRIYAIRVSGTTRG
jgi:hypothetical protein